VGKEGHRAPYTLTETLVPKTFCGVNYFVSKD
jgi:hypothetical protein